MLQYSRILFALTACFNAALAFAPSKSSTFLPSGNLFYRQLNSHLQMNKEADERLSQTFNGYTVKQRLREEVESPFRKVRLVFFLSSCGSALTALYFSSLSALKAYMGGYTDAMPLDEALTSCAINISGALVCGFLAYREYKVGEQNLERIARGGKLAKLTVSLASDEKAIVQLSEYRRNSRVLICAGGKDYIEKVCRSLNADQLKDSNNLADRLSSVNLILVPVQLNDSPQNKISVGDSKKIWRSTSPGDLDRNFDPNRSDSVVAFPWSYSSWIEYLQSDIQTAKSQGFDVLQNGITILVKKNGKILRRATGIPRWTELIEAMEVLDGSQFGIPGDSEIYSDP